MLNKEWEDDLRIITSGPTWNQLLNVPESFAICSRWKFLYCFIAHRLHYIIYTKVTQTPNSGLASFLGGGSPRHTHVNVKLLSTLSSPSAFLLNHSTMSEGQRNEGKEKVNLRGQALPAERGLLTPDQAWPREGFLQPVPSPTFLMEAPTQRPRGQFLRADAELTSERCPIGQLVHSLSFPTATMDATGKVETWWDPKPMSHLLFKQQRQRTLSFQLI